MGLKIRASEVTNYLNQVNTSLTRKNEGLNQIEQGLHNFINASELDGKAWRAAKSYAEATHIPILRGQIRANEEIMEDNKTFASRIGSVIENEQIDEDALEQIIQQLERQKQAIIYRNSLLENSPSFGTRNAPLMSDFSGTDSQIRKLRKEIESLRGVESSCFDLYTTADSLLSNVSQGLSSISSGSCWNESTGMYSTSHLNLEWSRKINKDWKEHFRLPTKLQKEIHAIKDDKSLSVEQKANKIAKIYDDYLYLQAKDAFDEYWKIRKQFPNGSPEREFAEAELAKVLQSLNIDIKAIVRNFGDQAIDVSGRNTLDYLQFIDMVNTRKPLDLKSRVFNDTDYSIWSRLWSKEFIIDGQDRSGDYLGNYLFGYYDQGALLFNGETLKMGAGVAQILSDTAKGDLNKLSLYGFYFAKDFNSGLNTWKTSGYSDNNGDGFAIQEGIDDFKKYIKSE